LRELAEGTEVPAEEQPFPHEANARVVKKLLEESQAGDPTLYRRVSEGEVLDRWNT
jgi:hypothetical protein